MKKYAIAIYKTDENGFIREFNIYEQSNDKARLEATMGNKQLQSYQNRGYKIILIENIMEV